MTENDYCLLYDIANKRVTDLEKENAELKSELTKKADTNHSLVEQMADLESENAELKVSCKIQVDTAFQMIYEKDDQLTKVNLLLKDVYKIAMDDWNDPKWHDQVLQKAREYLKEIKND